MSAPPLSPTGDGIDGASFYGITRSAGVSPEVEDSSTSQTNLEDPRQSIPRGDGFEIAVDLDLQQPLYIGEDGRMTQIRALDAMFREMAGSSTTSLSIETVMLLPSISRALIQFVGEYQANNGYLQKANAQLQADQHTMQSKQQKMEGNISCLQKDNGWLQETHRKLQYKHNDIAVEAIKLEQLCARIKSQKNALTAELDEIKAGLASDSGKESSNKRARCE